MNHIARLYLVWKEIDIYEYVSKETVEKIRQAKKELNNPDKLKPYFDYFEEKIDYAQIRLGLAVLERGG